MYPQMVYHADVRAREKELAAERQMGSSCSPLGRMISGVIRKCNGRKGRVRYDERMDDYAMAYAPAQTCYVRPSARTVTLASTPTANHPPANSDAVQPEPPRAHTPFPSTGAPPQGARKPKKKKKKKKKHVRFTPSAGPVPGDEPPPPPHAQHHAASTGGAAAGAGTASVVYHHGAAEAPYSSSPAAPPPAHGGHGGHGYAYGYGYGRYAPSPLPRWEVLGTPRRHEYFSSEYRWYYPTPVREGIYSFATDANGRLSNFFSEENPNACTIV